MPPVKRYGSSCRSWRNFLPIDSIYEDASSLTPPPPASARWRTSGSRCPIRSRRRNSGSRGFRTPGSLGGRPGRYAIARIRRLVSWLRSLDLRGCPPCGGRDSGPPPRAGRAGPRRNSSSSGPTRARMSKQDSRPPRTGCSPGDRRYTEPRSHSGIEPSWTLLLKSSATHEVWQEAGHEPQQSENKWIVATTRKGFMDLVRRSRLTIWQVFTGQILDNKLI